jgi:6-phosphofructokinase 1
MKRIGLLTGGGDAPGLNGIIESCTRVLRQSGVEVIGIQDGFDGVYLGKTEVLTPQSVHLAHSWAGTLLGSSNKTFIRGREVEFSREFKKLNLEGLIACGGDGTFEALSFVANEVKMIGVPKTIDNDLSGTDMTFGFDTACASVAESVEALRFTADAHKRVLIVETMGRTAGWIALGGGLASYADVILIPEKPFDRQELLSFIRQKQAAGQRGLMIVVAEGAKAVGEETQILYEVAGSPQKERYGGIAWSLARWIEKEMGWESRNVVLGHLQRAHAPTTTDRFLTLAMGIEAAHMALEGAWNQAVVYRNGQVTRAPLTDLMQAPRQVPADHRWVKFAQALGIFV